VVFVIYAAAITEFLVFKNLKRWFLLMKEPDPHVERIVENAREAVRRSYQVERVDIIRVDRCPCYAMKHLPRPGPAWFVVTEYPRVKNILIVEVDDTTQQVTRVWVPGQR
jgi:hypothetical protein